MTTYGVYIETLFLSSKAWGERNNMMDKLQKRNRCFRWQKYDFFTGINDACNNLTKG